MSNLQVAQTIFITVLDAIVLLIKVFASIITATYKLINPPEDTPVSSDIILITGSAQGIGKELALQYGKLGATLVCVDLNKGLNDATVNELKALGIKATAYSCDVTKREEVINLREKVDVEVGAVTIIVNNAGIMPCKRLLNHTEADIRKVFDVNIMAHFWILEAFLPAMMEKNRGHVVALSSIAGLEGYANVVPYNATKFAVRGLMEGLAEEFRQEGRAIKFTTICPFMVDTGLCKKPKIRFSSLLGMLSPVDVASTIIKAQRQGKQEISIPSYVRPFTFFLKLFPVSVNVAFHDFMNTGVEASDNGINSPHSETNDKTLDKSNKPLLVLLQDYTKAIKMSFQETVWKIIVDVSDAVIGLIKIPLLILWATLKIFVPTQGRSVARDIVLITGAAQGIGKELARQYGLLGATVICVDINEQANQETVKGLKQLDIKAYGFTCDISNREAVLALARAVRKEVGFVTILVNNAGIMPCKRFLNHTVNEIEKIFEINVLAQFWMIEAFLPPMISNDYGHVVALSSIAGLGGYPNLAPYCASKHAVRGLMDGLAAELREDKRSIGITIAYPFMVDTGLCKNPRIGFPKLLGMQKPEHVAARIISAQRMGHFEVSIPFFLEAAHNIERVLPDTAKQLIEDSLATGAEPHEN